MNKRRKLENAVTEVQMSIECPRSKIWNLDGKKMMKK